MICEALSDFPSRCYELAVRPVDNDYGACAWLCAKHGKGKKTYKLYRPEPTVLDLLAAIDSKRKWWHYAYIGTA